MVNPYIWKTEHLKKHEKEPKFIVNPNIILDKNLEVNQKVILEICSKCETKNYFVYPIVGSPNYIAEILEKNENYRLFIKNKFQKTTKYKCINCDNEIEIINEQEKK